MQHLIARMGRAWALGRRVLLGALATLSWLHVSALRAHACPDCTLGRAARREVWTDDFLVHLAAALAPFAVMVLLSAWADRLALPSERSRGPHG